MRQFFRIIEQEASRMRSLISDLLDVARIETGTLSVAPGPADVTRLVDEARCPRDAVVSLAARGHMCAPPYGRFRASSRPIILT